jgi:triacylglycerol lipase
MRPRSLLHAVPLAVKELSLPTPATSTWRDFAGVRHVATADGNPSPCGDTRRAPVVLVHGFGATVAVWARLRQQLYAEGFSHVVMAGYSAVRTDPATVCAGVAALCQAVGSSSVSSGIHLVGHSLGGLVARQVAQSVGAAVRVDTLVTIATPHRGSHAARLTGGGCARAMRPGSRWLAALDEQSLQDQTWWVNYYSELDLVVPRSSGRVAAGCAVNVVVGGRGHQGIASSPFLVDHLVGQLTASEARGHLVVA